MIRIRRAEPRDASAIARVHVAAWRSAYAGILPDAYLAQLSVQRQSHYYWAGLEAGHSAWVAEGDGAVVGFATAGRARAGPADGEVETLYVLDDWREQGLGRGLMQCAARRLASTGCRSAFLWVLRDNPSRWFYQRLGGRRVADSQVLVAGATVPKTAYVWDPIELLLTTPAQP